MKGLGNIMKQAQRMQAELQKTQERLADEEVTGEAGGGMVRIVMNGRHQVNKVHIDPSLLQDDPELLEDLIIAAMNSAVGKIAEKLNASLSNAAAGIPIPPGFKLPF
ncbi:nucleoid-associated protein [Achromatium sp. WMS3]|nr:nucleoid-associated protein [Achromatium sp. WMS3]